MTERTDRDPASDSATATDMDIAIVGGGLAGLVAANIAADAGLAVGLFDGHPLGGRARTEARDGYRLNQGPHALYRGAALDKALANFAIKVSGSKPALGASLGILGSTQGSVPTGLGTLLRTALLDGRGKRQFAALLIKLRRTKPASLASTTVDQWLAQEIAEPELRNLVRGLAMLSTYSCDSDIASADAAVANMQGAFGKGVVYLDHGWQQVVDRLAARIVGRVKMFEINVASLSRNKPAPSWTLIDGSGVTHSARAVIVAAGTPATAATLLGRDDLVAAAGPPVRAAALDLGLVRKPSVDFALSMVDNAYLSVHSVAEGLAPEGHSLVVAARYLRADDELGATESRAILDRHVAAAGIEPDDIVFERYLHKLVVTWGMPLAARGGLAGRPAVDQGDGCYLAGDWVGTEGLLADASAASATVAVRAAVTKLAGPS